jgi:hypothetical protein
VVDAHLAFFEANPDLMRVFHQVRGLLKFGRPEGLPLRRVLARYVARLAHVLAPRRPVAKSGAAAHQELATLVFGAVSGITSVRASLAATLPRNHRSRATIRALVALALACEGRASARVRHTPNPSRVRARRTRFGVRHRTSAAR